MDNETAEWVRIFFGKLWEKRIVELYRQVYKTWNDWWEGWK